MYYLIDKRECKLQVEAGTCMWYKLRAV